MNLTADLCSRSLVPPLSHWMNDQRSVSRTLRDANAPSVREIVFQARSFWSARRKAPRSLAVVARLSACRVSLLAQAKRHHHTTYRRMKLESRSR
jgi:hypothetical protein